MLAATGTHDQVSSQVWDMYLPKKRRKVLGWSHYTYLARKCAEGIAEAQGSTMAIEFILNSPGEWDILPKNGQVAVFSKSPDLNHRHRPQVMLGLKHQLVSSWGSEGLDVDKLVTKVTSTNNMELTSPGRDHQKDGQ